MKKRRHYFVDGICFRCSISRREFLESRSGCIPDEVKIPQPRKPIGMIAVNHNK